MHLDRVITVLEIVGQTSEASVGEICAHSGLPKPTAYRIVQDLVGNGLLTPVAKGRFSIGKRLRALAREDHSDAAVIAVSVPILRAAADAYGATFFLSRLRGREVEIVHAETPTSGVSYLHPGLGRRPLHACSCAKAVLAVMPNLLKPDEVGTGLRAYTSHTLTRRADLEEELAEIRTRGYAECVEEIEYGMASVAAPLATNGEGATMSIGATGSTRVFTPDFRAEIGGHLIGIAKETLEALAWGGKAELEYTA